MQSLPSRSMKKRRTSRSWDDPKRKAEIGRGAVMSRSPSARRSSRAPQGRKAAPAVGQSDDTSPQVAPTAKSDGPTAAEPTEAQREPDSQPTREPNVDAGV